MKRKGMIITGSIAVLLLLMFVGVTSGMGEIRKLVINDVDASALADGTYKGSYHKTRWTYDVTVTIADHKITSVINTNPKTGANKKFDIDIASAIIARQSPKVDVVSGATISTRAFARAVENALTAQAGN